jgi:hypothetical protein
MLKPSEIKVGDQYQYEETYYCACVVTILEDVCYRNWIGYKVRIDEVLFGNIDIGDIFNCGYDIKSGTAYKCYKIKPVGSMTDYCFLNTKENNK